jgi:hypothetical protein
MFRFGEGQLHPRWPKERDSGKEIAGGVLTRSTPTEKVSTSAEHQQRKTLTPGLLPPPASRRDSDKGRWGSGLSPRWPKERDPIKRLGGVGLTHETSAEKVSTSAEHQKRKTIASPLPGGRFRRKAWKISDLMQREEQPLLLSGLSGSRRS